MIEKQVKNMWKITRGNNWSDSEVKNLIDIWKEPEMREKIDSKKRFKMDTWSEIANRLVSLGYPTRTGAQVHNKIKDLRRSYHKARIELSGSGPGLIRQFPYYQMLSEVIRNRPIIPDSSKGNTEIELDDDDDSSIEALDEANTSISYALSGEEDNANEDRNISDVTEQVAQRGATKQENTEELEGSSQIQNTSEAPAGQGQYVQEKNTQNVEEAHASTSGTSQQPKTGKKRQKVSMKDKTVEALAKKMKEITSASDRKFLMIEEKRRKEELEQRKEDRKCMLHMMELIRQGMEDRKRAEEKRSQNFQALMEVLSRNSQPNDASTS